MSSGILITASGKEALNTSAPAGEKHNTDSGILKGVGGLDLV